MNGSRERDQSVEQLLRQSLRTPRSDDATDACLDAETLAAWVDGGLSGAALEMAQSHVADCARCQAMVGTLARINSVVPPAKPERNARRWLAWLVPLTAATAAVALWVAVPRDTGARLRQSTAVETAATRSNAQAPASLDDRVQAPPAAGINEPSPSSRGKDELLLPTVVERKSAANEAVDRNELSKTTSELRRDARLEADRAKQQTASAAAATPPAPAAAAPAAFADKGVGAVVGGVARSVDRAAESAATEIMSPDPAVRWRIVGARLQRSTNGGVLWEAATTGITAALTAGAAPSASVCWVVGRGGVVLLSTDSRSWRRVPFPEATDLSAVRASDARTASVSTADGRTFSTTDGGVTWVLR